jgi:hypothetical protein
MSSTANATWRLRSHTSRLSVHGHGDHSHVNWVAQFEADSPELEPELAQEFGRIYREGLTSLRGRVEVDAPE